MVNVQDEWKHRAKTGEQDPPPSVSIIVPAHKSQDIVKRCVDHCRALDYPAFEIIVIVDEGYEFPPDFVTVLRTGKTGSAPGFKRNLGIDHTSSKFCAFVDDDAYPRRDWLKKAVSNLEADENIGAVGGPGLSPVDESLPERISSAFYSSILGTGPLAARYTTRTRRRVAELPAYNLVVRRSVLHELNGFPENYYGGEDSFVCKGIAEKGLSILYDPEVVVYHSRREFPIPHLKQIWNVAIHRGYFFRKKIGESRKIVYLLPLMILVALPSVLLLMYLVNLQLAILIVLVILYSAILVSGLPRNSLMISLILPFVAVSSHATYAIGFLKGLLTRRLER